MTAMQKFVTEWLNACPTGTPESYSMDDARDDLRNMRVVETELPDGITEESLHEAVNWYIDEYKRLNAEPDELTAANQQEIDEKYEGFGNAKAYAKD